MDPSQRQYLIVKGLVVILGLVVVSFFFGRRGTKPPVKLDLQKPPDPPLPEPQKQLTGNAPTSAPPGWNNYRPRQRPNLEEDATAAPVAPTREKKLNVMFNWNGHSWDAYEVLGVPAGSSREAVSQAYQRICSTSDPESLPFLKAAFEAILRS